MSEYGPNAFLVYLKHKYHANKKLLDRIQEDTAGIHLAETENKAIEKTFKELEISCTLEEE